MRRLLTTTVLFAALGSCKTAQEAITFNVAPPSKLPQCDVLGAKGSCKVVEIEGRQGTSTDVVRKTELGDVSDLKLTIPPGSEKGHTEVRFARKSGPLEEWTMDAALDLYSRAGCLAEVSGGVFGEGYSPRLTLRLLFNLQDEARTGFAEVSDYRNGKPIQATLAVKCDWQK